MTYAGLKSMIYAGVKKDDPRVVAARRDRRKACRGAVRVDAAQRRRDGGPDRGVSRRVHARLVASASTVIVAAPAARCKGMGGGSAGTPGRRQMT